MVWPWTRADHLFARADLLEKAVWALVRRTEFERRKRDRTEHDTA